MSKALQLLALLIQFRAGSTSPLRAVGLVPIDEETP